MSRITIGIGAANGHVWCGHHADQPPLLTQVEHYDVIDANAMLDTIRREFASLRVRNDWYHLHRKHIERAIVIESHAEQQVAA